MGRFLSMKPCCFVPETTSFKAGDAGPAPTSPGEVEEEEEDVLDLLPDGDSPSVAKALILTPALGTKVRSSGKRRRLVAISPTRQQQCRGELFSSIH